MKQQNQKGLLRRINPALVLSIVAVFLALSGAAVALPGINTVNSGDVKDNALKTQDLKDGKAVSGPDVVPDSITSSGLGANSVRASELGTFHTHSDTVVVAGGAAENGNYNTAAVNATCANGEQLISGGGYWNDNAAGEELFISEIQPSTGDQSVTVTGGNDSGNNRTLVATAVCLG